MKTIHSILLVLLVLMSTFVLVSADPTNELEENEVMVDEVEQLNPTQTETKVKTEYECPYKYKGYKSKFGKSRFSHGYWVASKIVWLLIKVVLVILILWMCYKFLIKKEAFDSPLVIVKKRYARGEITKKEFDKMKKDLK